MLDALSANFQAHAKILEVKVNGKVPNASSEIVLSEIQWQNANPTSETTAKCRKVRSNLFDKMSDLSKLNSMTTTGNAKDMAPCNTLSQSFQC